MNSVQTDSTTAWFGKLPTHGDFVRGGLDGPAGRAFEGWLTSAVEGSSGVIPGEPVRFVITLEGQGTMVGTWVPSRDAVGRQFPLSAWLHVPADVECAHWSLLVSYYAPFLAAAESALLHGRELGSETLDLSLRALCVPHASELPALLATSRQTLDGARLSSFASRNLGGRQLDTLPYALATWQQALALAEPELTLDMPAAELDDVFIWLELALVLRAPRAKPTCIAWVPATQRLLVCIDGLPVQLLAYLIAPDHRSSRRWPMSTTSKEAAVSACAALDARLVQALEADVTVGQLLELARAVPR